MAACIDLLTNSERPIFFHQKSIGSQEDRNLQSTRRGDFKCPSLPPHIFNSNRVFATGFSPYRGFCNSPSHPPGSCEPERNKNCNLAVMGKGMCFACEESSEFPGLLVALVIAMALMLTCYATPRRRPVIVRYVY
ncbi:hypothetical protein EUGRSUZ_K03440 [Eucalyptus grandis]|uniref:Uncharacterized protein n=2 Tax=Eucalyptus grandis TaxID=71139 RepID=A0A059A8E4_EUCGR|nr:hypothetical protein EUGRSUZ_K03440 [Eucalyptus grandis]